MPDPNCHPSLDGLIRYPRWEEERRADDSVAALEAEMAARLPLDPPADSEGGEQ